jgi:predicted Zn-dependent peptidase
MEMRVKSQYLSLCFIAGITGAALLAAPVQAAKTGHSPTTKPIAKASNTSPTSKPAKATSKPLDAGAQLRRRVVEVKLKNGMLFLLVRRTGAPTFSAYIRVRAGGVDEKNGLTGLAHIFEHMAFKGTSLVGTHNWPKERKLLKRMTRVGEALSDAMVRAQGKETPAIKVLKKMLKGLQQQHKALVKTNEFTKLYSANGGVGLNATTGKDLTSYFLSLPANRLALWALQESSRLAAPVFREFYRERAVVAEERRMAMSRGGGRLYEAFMATAFQAHPYRLPTVGWMSDITTIPVSAVKRFFKRYYAPSNMVGTIVGDIDIKRTKALLEVTFGKIPAGSPPPPVRTREPKQQGERRVQVQFHTNPEMLIGFHKPTAPHKDDDVFDIISALLTDGPSSRLYKALVKAKMAQSVWASSLPGSRYPNVFTIGLKPIAPHSTKALEAIVYKELERLKTEPVSPKELRKILNNSAMSFLRGLRSNQGLASQLSYFQAVIGDWRYATQHNKRLQSVTPKAIMAVAKRYFRRSNRTVATLVQVKKAKASSPTSIFGRRKPQAQRKLSPAQRKKRLTAKFRMVVGMLRQIRQKMRKTKPTKAIKKQYGQLIKQARALYQAIRSLKIPARSAKTAKQLSPKETQRRARVYAQVKAMLKQSPAPSLTVRPLPKGLQRHPATLTSKPVAFQPPTPTIVTLNNGMVLYLLEDRELPLIDIFAIVKTGRLYDPKGKIGLAEMMGKVMRTGGFGSLTGDQLDEALAFRAAKLRSTINAEFGLATLSIHRKDLTWGLGMLSGMLRSPRFPKKKINLERVRMMERHRRYNDQPFRIGIHHFRKVVFGPTHRRAQKPTPRSIVTIKRKDLVAFHKAYYHPNAIRMAVVGDFDTKQMLARLRKTFGAKAWKRKAITYPTIPTLPSTNKPKIVLIDRDIPQTVIIVGHLGPRRHHPQLLAGKVMNHILGGGGFSSRLMTEIRTKRGLAYFAGSQLMEDTDRGLFAAYTGTRPQTTAKALHTLLQQLRLMASTGAVTNNELTLAKKTFLNQFVFRFQSPAQIVFRTAYYNLFGYPKKYLETYRPKLTALTAKSIKKAANTFLRPKQFVILVVGPKAKFDKPLSQFGKVTEIKLP